MADKITKLSQAIRLGSTFRPQCAWVFYDREANSSCVLGAAYEAVTGEPFVNDGFHDDVYALLQQRFNVKYSLLSQLADRNNGGESRESIAADLEQQGL